MRVLVHPDCQIEYTQLWGGGRGGRLIDDQMVEIPYIWHFQKSLSTANSSSNTEVRRSPALASAENVLPLQQWLVEEI